MKGLLIKAGRSRKYQVINRGKQVPSRPDAGNINGR